MWKALIVLALVVGVVGVACAADVPVRVTIDGKVQPYHALVRAGTAYVPLRAGAQSLGYTVEWLAREKAAKVCNANACILLKQSEGITVRDSIFLPLRKMAEAFSAKVVWDPVHKEVHILRPQR
jgi:hypothetical protein